MSLGGTRRNGMRKASGVKGIGTATGLGKGERAAWERMACTAERG